MIGRIRLLSLALLAISAAVLVAAGPASASSPGESGTVAINSSTAGLVAQVLIEVPLTYSCGPMDTVTDEETEVHVQQAVANGGVAIGEGHFDQNPTICDGATRTVMIQVLPVAGLHFHRGLAIVKADLLIGGQLSGSNVFVNATMPWQKIRLRRSKS
jgi:hypothetical protein